MLRKRNKSMMGGIVSSPTPTVPISGDSMTVMTVAVPGRARAKMLAAIQPAVPPPTIAMRLICLVSLIAQALRIANESRGEGRPFLALLPAAGKNCITTPGDRRGGARMLELAFHAEKVTASAIVISERQIWPLQIRVLFGVGQVLE